MDIVLHATAMFAVVYLLIRLLGQMMPFEFITLVVAGDLIQQGATWTGRCSSRTQRSVSSRSATIRPKKAVFFIEICFNRRYSGQKQLLYS